MSPGRALSAGAVRSIRWYHDEGWTHFWGQWEVIGRMYGISSGAARSIGYRLTRRDVPERQKRRENQ
jgi:hypothetical protein